MYTKHAIYITTYTQEAYFIMGCSGVRRHSNLGGHRGLTGLICMAKTNFYGEIKGEIIKSAGGIMAPDA